jgi:hypothetical protein
VVGDVAGAVGAACIVVGLSGDDGVDADSGAVLR